LPINDNFKTYFDFKEKSYTWTRIAFAQLYNQGRVGVFNLPHPIPHQPDNTKIQFSPEQTEFIKKLEEEGVILSQEKYNQLSLEYNGTTEEQKRKFNQIINNLEFNGAKQIVFDGTKCTFVLKDRTQILNLTKGVGGIGGVGAGGVGGGVGAGGGAGGFRKRYKLSTAKRQRAAFSPSRYYAGNLKKKSNGKAGHNLLNTLSDYNNYYECIVIKDGNLSSDDECIVIKDDKLSGDDKHTVAKDDKFKYGQFLKKSSLQTISKYPERINKEKYTTSRLKEEKENHWFNSVLLLLRIILDIITLGILELIGLFDTKSKTIKSPGINPITKKQNLSKTTIKEPQHATLKQKQYKKETYSLKHSHNSHNIV